MAAGERSIPIYFLTYYGIVDNMHSFLWYSDHVGKVTRHALRNCANLIGQRKKEAGRQRKKPTYHPMMTLTAKFGKSIMLDNYKRYRLAGETASPNSSKNRMLLG